MTETEFKDSRWWGSMGTLVANGVYGPVFYSNDVLLLQRGFKNETLIRSILDRIETQSRTR